jgi:hypothetical protein
MHERPPAIESRRLERAIILQLLSEQVAARLSRAQLAAALGNTEETLAGPLQSLAEAGAIHSEGSEVWASEAARRLDALGLIAI